MSLRSTRDKMVSLARSLIPYSTPVAGAESDEAVRCLKTRWETVDGYDLKLLYSEGRFQKYDVCSLEITADKDGRHLPFSLVCKVGQEFLGRTDLVFFTLERDHGQSYCWSKRVSDVGSIPHADSSGRRLSYEGLEFVEIEP